MHAVAYHPRLPYLTVSGSNVQYPKPRETTPRSTQNLWKETTLLRLKGDKGYNIFLCCVVFDELLNERVIKVAPIKHLLQPRKGQHHSDDSYCTIEITSQNRPRWKTSKNFDVPISFSFLSLSQNEQQ
jgi:hypothetical protein